MKTHLWAVGLTLAAVIITSFAQIFYKLTAEMLVYSNPMTYITNYPFIIALILFGIGGVFFMRSLKGGDVTVLYPLFATSYILVMLFSKFFFSEAITSHKWVGVAIIILGITIIGIGSKKKKSVLQYEPGAI